MPQTLLDEAVIRYIMSRLGCTHPFYISRVLLLAESRALDTLGRRITGLTFRGESYGFYVEELPRMIEKLENEGCAQRHEEKGCIEYTCSQPSLPEEIRHILDQVIEETSGMEPAELNRAAINDKNYGNLLR